MANSLIASASVEPVNITGPQVSAPAVSRSAKPCAAGVVSPTMIREGCRLSQSARPSRRNSGENRIASLPCSARIRAVKPTGTVDLTTTVAPGAKRRASEITCSTLAVSKRLVRAS